MGNIYELTGEFLKFSEIASSGELSEEQSEMLNDALANLKEDIEYKLEGYCKVRANFKADCEMLKVEEKRLADRRKALEAQIKRMEEAMKAAILAVKPADDLKVKTPLFSINVQNNPESVVMDVEGTDLIPEEYLKFKEPEVNLSKIKEDIKAGKDLSALAHLERTQSVRVR